MSDLKKKFIKPALSTDEHIQLMLDRGLVISDTQSAAHYLAYIGYYRLSIYMLPFQKADRSEQHHHDFATGTCFEDVLNLYLFDRKLRLLVMDALERIEVAIKSLMIDEMCVSYGSHWYMNPHNFSSEFNHDDFLEQVKKQIGIDQGKIGDIVIRHYYDRYNHPSLPPFWMVSECLSFGTISLMYKFLRGADQKRIADKIGLPVKVLKSWLHSCVYLRNLCAHHARLWNRIFTIRPLVMERYKEEFVPNTLFYAQAVMIYIILKQISPETDWARRLMALMDEYHDIDIQKMGFRGDWRNRTLGS